MAVQFTGYEIEEESIGTKKCQFGMVGKVKPFSADGESAAVLSEDRYQRILTAFREGMNATNVFYQALSFAKAMEGCRNLRNKKIADARAAGQQPLSPSIEVPSRLEDIPRITDAEVRQFFQPLSEMPSLISIPNRQSWTSIGMKTS